jgi:hypothetical protein
MQTEIPESLAPFFPLLELGKIKHTTFRDFFAVGVQEYCPRESNNRNDQNKL